MSFSPENLRLTLIVIYVTMLNDYYKRVTLMEKTQRKIPLSPPLGKGEKWLLLLYQLPTQPSNLRVKVWRKLQKLGAINVKSAAYLLPYNETTEEDFRWLSQEIIDGGGEAILLVAYGLSLKEEEEIVRLFQEARAKDYEEFIEECKQKTEQLELAIQQNHVETWQKYEAENKRLQSRLAEIQAIDFFSSPKKKDALAALEMLSDTLQRAKGISEMPSQIKPEPLMVSEYKNKIWVTRAGMHIDRLASAWLIKRFLDSIARFEFVPAGVVLPSTEDKIPFDMYGASFSHHGEDCTFETLLKCFRLENDVALSALAQIVHDIDIKDNKFGRTEAAGIDFVVLSFRQKWKDDEVLLEKGLALFDALYDKLRPEELNKGKT